MPELGFKITGISAAVRGVAPLLAFELEITNTPPAEEVPGILLQAQVQIQAPGRAYNDEEKDRLFELFGPPAQWGQTLRNRLFAIANTAVGPFAGRKVAQFVVPCTYDLNIAATKYFRALDGGDIPLLFLFSGTVFYNGADGRLQAAQISWNKECTFHLPVATWQAMMDEHYPNSAWLGVQREVFDRLCEFRRTAGYSNWEQAFERLLVSSAPQERVTA